ncbi:MAG: efflux RND transporter permease subunit, partial [Sphingobacteriia bacterium]
AEIGLFLSDQPLVKHYQAYVGTAGPISFNGLVRHYDLRKGETVADLVVNLVDKSERTLQSHDLVKSIRPAIQAIAQKHGAVVKLVEVPPGPPVLSTLVAEIYGPDYAQQIALGKQVKKLFAQTKDVVDIDWMMEDDQLGYRVVVNKEKAMQYGIATAQINAAVAGASSGWTVGALQTPRSYAQTPIRLQLTDADKSSMEQLLEMPIQTAQGQTIALGNVVTVERNWEEKTIYRKNQKEVVYVLADMAGDLESPFYAISKMSEDLKKLTLPPGFTLQESYTAAPANEDQFTLKWDGEWQITFEVFRDLGIAFGAVLIIIYILIVGWFQNFTVPLVMLAAIPLSLIGIVGGHWMMGAYFTATSMIGFIALAGVMVRNSILLIDFINLRLAENIPLKQAIIEAGAVRTTPILLTAGAVVLGAVIILFDPIFQGLAISLIGGTLTSTFLTLLVVPLLYFKMMRNKTK